MMPTPSRERDNPRGLRFRESPRHYDRFLLAIRKTIRASAIDYRPQAAVFTGGERGTELGF